MLQQTLLSILQAIAIVATPIIAKAICEFLYTKKEEVSNQINNENEKKLLADAFDAVATAVRGTNQTYVDALKKSGQFSVENQREAFQRAYDTAISIMTQEAKDLIEDVYGGLYTWLTVNIEAQVKADKDNNTK